VPFQVVHAQHGLVQGSPQRAGHPGPHEQGAGQAGAPGKGDHVDVLQGLARIAQHLLRQRQHAADVVAAGQLRHHPAIGAVHVDLAVQGVGQQRRHTAVGRHAHQGHAGFIARRFNTQDQLTHRAQV